ncbi:hypothetical protein GCM10009864_78760 [Streptomyces lunalinharesii]|uniref:Uncharacterized protein n=1 Tax=Streptomyces lunalinharesii TaxID=333384 RepID=A0ABP6FK06_9ACTN
MVVQDRSGQDESTRKRVCEAVVTAFATAQRVAALHSGDRPRDEQPGYQCQAGPAHGDTPGRVPVRARQGGAVHATAYRARCRACADAASEVYRAIADAPPGEQLVVVSPLPCVQISLAAAPLLDVGRDEDTARWPATVARERRDVRRRPGPGRAAGCEGDGAQERRRPEGEAVGGPMVRRDGREPIRLGAVIGVLVTERAWEPPAGGATLREWWAAIAPSSPDTSRRSASTRTPGG